MIARQTVCLDGERKRAVPEGDKDARFLLVREGHEIDDALIDQYDGARDLIGSAAKKQAQSDFAKPEAPKPAAPKPEAGAAKPRARKRAAKKAAKKAKVSAKV